MDEIHAWHESYFITDFYFRNPIYFIQGIYFAAFKIKRLVLKSSKNFLFIQCFLNDLSSDFCGFLSSGQCLF